MTRSADVVVVGGGIGGMVAAVLLGARGLRVLLVERAGALGGKAGVREIDGVEVDTGPSVLTLPDVFEDVFSAVGMRLRDEVALTRPEPAFRYVYPDGLELDVFHELERTLESVRASLGGSAATELAEYLAYARRIWEAAAPHFVTQEAPTISGLLLRGPAKMRAVAQIDPFRSMAAAIDSRVKSPHLRRLLMRYATYNGSDVRRAPATLGCIAHVELALGGYGVQGGIYELVRALQRALERAGVEVLLDSGVGRLALEDGRVVGVETVGGRRISARQVVVNADVGQLNQELMPPAMRRRPRLAPSMSAHTGILRAARRPAEEGRVAHTVVFPDDYEQEFADIFDAGRVPRQPTVYLCAQEACHGRRGWSRGEPLFTMVNAPAVGATRETLEQEALQSLLLERLVRRGLCESTDDFVWWRTPADLAAGFPGSSGSLYGAASNGKTAAFQRPANRHPEVAGLYLASGSAHPGGGLPMVAMSGKQAVRAALQDRGERL